MIQGFSGGLLNRQLIYNLDLPSFQRDFASLKTLDHGTGPAITFTRASNATYFDANGALQTAANDVPRFDHSQDGAANSLGLLIEESRTNSIRNSQAGGSTNGVIGSGGVMPMNWIGGTANGVTQEIVGTGTESGLAYIDVKFSGTPTVSSGSNVVFESNTHIVASNGQTWSVSAYVRLVAGTLANVTPKIVVSGRDAAGAQIGTQISSPTISPSSSSLASQRVSTSITFSDAGVARVLPFVNIAYTSGNPIDLTLRIAAPQLEQGAFPTSYIPTTTAAATRSADSAVVTPISSFYNQSEGTLFAEVREGGGDLQYGAVSLDTDTSDNRIDLRRNNDAGVLTMIVTTGGALQMLQSPVLAVAAQVYKLIGAYKTNDCAACVNGGSIASDNSVTLATLTHFRIGGLAAASPATGNAFSANGHIRRIAYYPKRLSNTLLQQLTT